jgi:hypothetical protein
MYYLVLQMLLAGVSNVAAIALPTCVLELRGPLKAAGSFRCEGGSVSAALHRSLLQAGTFRIDGIKLGPRTCQRRGCLITICSDSSAIISANVTSMSVPGADIPSILCLPGRANIIFKSPTFIGNNATSIYTMQSATARIEDGLFRDGVAPSGPGFIARGSSTVEIFRSRFINNTCFGW